MTIPIIPGPFSFLQGAGEALGAYGAAKEEHRRYAQDTARKALEHWDNLVQIGIFPAKSMQSPEYGHLTDLAGFGGAPAGEVLPQPKEMQAERIAGMTGSRQDLALGLPSEAAGLTEDIKARALKQVTPGGAAERAVAGVKPEAVAAGEENAALAGTEASTATAKLQTNIQQGALKLMGSDPKAAHIAQLAASGALQFYIEELRFQRQYMTDERARRSDNTRMLLGLLQSGVTTYNTDYAAWDRQYREVVANAAKPKMPNLTTPTQEEQAAIVDSWVKGNPEPTFDSSVTRTLDAAGLKPEQFSEFISGGLELGDPESAKRGKARAGAGGAPGTPQRDPQVEQVSITLRYLQGTEPRVGGAHLGQVVKKGKLSELQATMILSQMRRFLGNNFEQFQSAYDEAKGGASSEAK